MSHLIFFLITSVLNITSQGRRIFNITLNHVPSCSLRHTALDTPTRPRNIASMHNTAGAIIVAYTKTVLIDDNMDTVGAGASGMGGMVKGKEGETGSCRYCEQYARPYILPHSFRLSFSWHGRRCKPLLHDSAASDAEIPAPIRPPCPICTCSAFPRWRAQLHYSTSPQYPTHSHSSTSQIH